MPKQTLRVTAAIIYRDGKILICQRPKEKACGLLWEFPGGKIEPGETPEACIARECREELDIRLGDVRYFCDAEHEYPDKIIRISFYKTTLGNDQQVSPKEHNDIAWVDKSVFGDYAFCPTDAGMIEKNIGLL